MNPPSPTTATPRTGTVDDAEVARFSALADLWWDTRGAFAPLHKFNPVRLQFLADQAGAHFGRNTAQREPFKGLRLLDVGCGGGLLSEPMRRLGFEVTAVDASERNIGVARLHAQKAGLEIDYRACAVEDLAAAGQLPFDLVLNMEVIEHTSDPAAFLRMTADLIAPGGMMVVATLNRTAKAFALAVVGAEYVLGWLPRGTHDWRKFLKPQELRAMLASSPVQVEGPIGVSFDPLLDRWSLSADSAVNYLMVVRRPQATAPSQGADLS